MNRITGIDCRRPAFVSVRVATSLPGCNSYLLPLGRFSNRRIDRANRDRPEEAERTFREAETFGRVGGVQVAQACRARSCFAGHMARFMHDEDRKVSIRALRIARSCGLYSRLKLWETGVEHVVVIACTRVERVRFANGWLKFTDQLCVAFTVRFHEDCIFLRLLFRRLFP